jgi:hypothetical protein
MIGGHRFAGYLNLIGELVLGGNRFRGKRTSPRKPSIDPDAIGETDQYRFVRHMLQAPGKFEIRGTSGYRQQQADDPNEK